MSSSGPSSEGESQMRDEECLCMAAFRIDETAKRIAMLADRVPEPELRRALHTIRDRLVSEEQALHRATSCNPSKGVNKGPEDGTMTSGRQTSV